MDVIHKIGRRKTAVARVYLSKGKGNITVNKKDVNTYFPTATLQYKVNQPLVLTENEKNFEKELPIYFRLNRVRISYDSVFGKICICARNFNVRFAFQFQG